MVTSRTLYVSVRNNAELNFFLHRDGYMHISSSVSIHVMIVDRILMLLMCFTLLQEDTSFHSSPVKYGSYIPIEDLCIGNHISREL